MTEPAQPFKKCSTCKASWHQRVDFLSDNGIELVGYQQNYLDMKAGYFLFNHSCENTLALSVVDFLDLYNGTLFETSLDGTEECTGLCQRPDNLAACPKKCECAFVRSIMQVLLSWPKNRGTGKLNDIVDEVPGSDRHRQRI
jgi:hypothetical protein